MAWFGLVRFGDKPGSKIGLKPPKTVTPATLTPAAAAGREEEGRAEEAEEGGGEDWEGGRED
jgi:hypothetical protein